MRKLLLTVLLLVPGLAWGQNTNTMPPMCTAATLLTTCVPQVQGTVARITDAASATVCTGGGTTDVTCEYDGSAWVSRGLQPSGGTWTGANGETIDNDTDSVFLFTNDTNGVAPIIRGVDGNGSPSGITIEPSGSGSVIIGSTSSAQTEIITNNGVLALDASANILRWTAAATETATFTGADATSPADTIYDTTGAGDVQIGSIDVLEVTLLNEGLSLDLDVVADTASLRNIASGDVVLDFRDYGDTTDDDMAHASLTANCTTVSTGAEDCDLYIATTEAGSNETRISIVGDGDIQLNGGDVVMVIEESATFGAPDQMFTDPKTVNQYIGIPRLNVTQLGDAIADGTATAEPYSPLIASCAPITAGTEAAGTLRITGAASYQYTAQGTAVDNDGFDCDVTGHAVNGTDSIGFWIRSDTALTAGTLDVTLDDGTVAEANANLGAITVVDEWQWMEVDFDTDCDATCADIDGIFIQVTAAGAATSEMDGTIIHIDSGAFWLSGAETAIGDIQVGGLISVSVAAVASGTANTASELVEYTDYIVNYQTGADAVVFITDQSANYGWTLEALND